jgi:acetoacetyl-CoA reductase/3-oxoacyl-[acyl-carrier protein] reductase
MSASNWTDVKLPLVPGAALVTGAASGIGGSVLEALLAHGVRVAAVDCTRPGAELEALSRSGTVLFLRRDVRDFDGAVTAVREATEQLGPISMLIACAGIARDAASWKMSEEDWRAVIEVDLTGSFTYARAVAPGLRNLGHGRIVFVSSINGLRGKFGQANYAAAKAGLVGLAKTLARELGPRGVTVNVVAPGMVRTPMTANLPTETVERARAETVLGRLADPEDVAGSILFLCSTLARHVTGSVLPVDGGQAL